MRPDLVVVMFDADGERDRKSRLDSALSDSVVPYVLAMSVQELEAWLIADPDALREAGCQGALSSEPEQMPPREAKQWLANATTRSGARDLRSTLAKLCNLDIVARRCPSFNTFRRDITSSRDPC